MNSILILLSLLTLIHTQCHFRCTACLAPDANGVVNYNCTACAWGYYLEGSACHSCDQTHYEVCQDYFDKLKIDRSMIALSISAFIMVLIVVILCCGMCKKYKCCTNEQQPQINQNEINERTLSYLAPNNLQISQIQLKKFVGQKKWKQTKKEVDGEQICVICLQSGVFLQTNCKHRFHPNCIWAWIVRNHDSCPVCKSLQILPVKVSCHKCVKYECEVNFIPSRTTMNIKELQYCVTCTKQQNQ